MLWGSITTFCPDNKQKKGEFDRQKLFDSFSFPLVVAVHSHPLRAAAHLAIGSRADGSAAVTLRAGLLQSQKLLGTEGLVVDLGCRLNEVLEVGAEQEVSEVDELAVVLVLNVDHAPPVLATANLLAINNDRLLGTNNSEGDQVLVAMSAWCYASLEVQNRHVP